MMPLEGIDEDSGMLVASARLRKGDRFKLMVRHFMYWFYIQSVCVVEQVCEIIFNNNSSEVYLFSFTEYC